MHDDKILSLVRKFALEHSNKDDIHGFIHVGRVYNLCIRIGKLLDADLIALKVASLLHDIGRISENEDPLRRNHAEISAEIARNFLKSIDINFKEDTINNIIHSIQAHSFSNFVKPETLEAKILSDADKLDALGAIGLYRTIGFTVLNDGGIKEVIEHLEKKILKLKDLLYLEVSREIAEQRQKIIVDFYNKIKEQIN